ncbi:MBL fold metallo-hydrolase [Streptomyces canus]|uniref:MBL fold metallo-hydrolase n=1 Tax=Streptomyces canus TaxID=58343 RepID=UPI0022501DDC|nr:MBL fold metallo-hydrolase [Streptomyces canus]MCX5257856.1 MBL fold metallo-hydrolase [Streptomyces canus]
MCHRALVDGLAAIGHCLADISAVHVTHSHLDHYYLAIQLRHELGLSVTLGRGEEDSLAVAAENRDDLIQTAQLHRYGQGEECEEFERGLRRPDFPFHLAWEPPDRWLDGGEKLDLGALRLDVVDMPGHTRGSLVFRDDAAGVLFSGDSVLPHITPSVGFDSRSGAICTPSSSSSPSPTRRCCPRTARSWPAHTAASRSCSVTTTSGWSAP